MAIRSQAYDNIYSVTDLREQTTNTGTGTYSTAEKYIKGSLRVFIDGTLVHSTRITETSEKTYTVSSPPGATSRITTFYNPIS